LNSPENVPYILVSNLIKITIPDTIYVAELFLKEEAIIERAKKEFGLTKKRPEKQLLVKLALRLAGTDLDGWVIHENRIFSFYNFDDEPGFRSIVDTGTLEELQPEDLSEHSLIEYQNLFKYLLKDTVKDQLKLYHIAWSKQQRQFYFLPEDNESSIRKIEWIGKKAAKRTVYKRNFQTKDPSKIAFHRHLSFDLSFLDISFEWYAIITPSWYFTWNLYRKNRFHDDLLSRQKRLEHNHSVRNLVRFIAYFLTHNTSQTDKIYFGGLEEFQCFSQISLEGDEQSYDAEEDVDDAD